MSHLCPICDRRCTCWDGDNSGVGYCMHEETPQCHVHDDLRDDFELDDADAHDDYADWWDDE